MVRSNAYERGPIGATECGVAEILAFAAPLDLIRIVDNVMLGGVRDFRTRAAGVTSPGSSGRTSRRQVFAEKLPIPVNEKTVELLAY